MNYKHIQRRIAFIIGEMTRDGAERVISILANSYAEKGWKIDIIMLLNDRSGYYLHENIELIPICRKNMSRIMQSPLWVHDIREYIKQKQPYCIVSFIARINIVALLSCIGSEQKIIVSERNDPAADGRSIFTKLATHVLYPRADHVVFQTKWAQSCFSEKIQSKSVIIPNPVNVTISASNEKKRKIVAVGRLEEQKNHQMLIRAFKKVHDINPEYCLFIYGEGRLRGKLLELIEDLSLLNAVFLPGNVSDIHSEIADAMMFVLSSNYEGLSNALLEAMMMGLPCISTNCAGSNEIIENGKNGIIIPVKQEAELVKAMLLLITHKELAYQIALGAQEKCCEFEKTSVVKKWQDLIGEI